MENEISTTVKVTIGVVIIFIVALILALLTRATFFNYVERHEFPYMFDAYTGEIKEIDKQGYVFSYPFIQKIYTFETRPIQICLQTESMSSSVNSRVLNCKLVRFVPKYYRDFIALHGAYSYDASALRNILRIYAFEEDLNKSKYPFLAIEKTLIDENIQDSTDIKR